jgi:hypothetical protein
LGLRGTKQQRSGENYITSSFILHAPHQILLGVDTTFSVHKSTESGNRSKDQRTTNQTSGYQSMGYREQVTKKPVNHPFAQFMKGE